jgi:hypothetical protein
MPYIPTFVNAAKASLSNLDKSMVLPYTSIMIEMIMGVPSCLL